MTSFVLQSHSRALHSTQISRGVHSNDVEKKTRRILIVGNIHLVLLTELLGEGGAHNLVANVRRGGEVRLAGLTPGRGNVCNTIQ